MDDSLKRIVKNIVFSVIGFVVACIILYFDGGKELLDNMSENEKKEASTPKDLVVTAKVDIADDGTAHVIQQNKYHINEFENEFEVNYILDNIDKTSGQVSLEKVELTSDNMEVKEGPTLTYMYGGFSITGFLNVDEDYSDKSSKYVAEHLINSEVLQDNVGKDYTLTTEYSVDKNIVVSDGEYDVINIPKIKDFLLRNVEYVIDLKLPNEANKIQFTGKENIQYLGDSTYRIILNKKNGESDTAYLNTDIASIRFDKGVFNFDGSYVPSNDKTTDFEKIDSTNNENIYIVSIIGLISIVNFIYLYFSSRKVYVPKDEVKRDTDNMVDPILAEAIIDKKIGTKELIMSCVVDLVLRNNIQCINNEKIKLLSKEGLNSYENDIVDLLFNNVGDEVEFKDFDTMFIKDNVKTSAFADKLRLIKSQIENKLYNEGIFRQSHKMIQILIKAISFMLVFNCIIALAKLTGFNYIITNEKILIGSIIVFIVSIFSSMLYEKTGRNIFTYRTRRIYSSRRRADKFEAIIYTILASIALIMGVLAVLQQNTFYIIMLVVLLFINICNIIRCKSFAFTLKGRQEYRKVKALKNYLENYSLLKDRELESHIIWDKYLAYAVAFGMPNQILSKINDKALNANIALQRVDEFLEL